MGLDFEYELDLMNSLVGGIIEEECRKLGEWLKHSLKTLTIDELKYIAISVEKRGVTFVDNVCKSQITYVLSKSEKPRDLKTTLSLYYEIHKDDKL